MRSFTTQVIFQLSAKRMRPIGFLRATDDTGGDRRSKIIAKMQPRSRRTPSTASKASATSSASSVVTETDHVTEVVEWDQDRRQLNQYRLGERLGEGSSAVVYRAEDLNSGLQFAIKEISRLRMKRQTRRLPVISPGTRRSNRRPKLATSSQQAAPTASTTPNPIGGDKLEATVGSRLLEQSAIRTSASEDGMEAIRKEIAILKQLEHPHIIRLFEVLDDPKTEMLYMVFELCSRGPLMRIELDSTVAPLSEDDARKYFVQLLSGIEYLHSHNVAHRDIKPENLLLDDQGQLKIADFGVSEFIDPDSDGLIHNTAGSPAFMSPESLSVTHGKFSPWAADIWAMGVSLYCFLAGRLPFAGDSIVRLQQNIREIPFNPLENVSGAVKDLLMKMLEKDPTRRITLNAIREHPWLEYTQSDLKSAALPPRKLGFFISLLRKFRYGDVQNRNSHSQSTDRPEPRLQVLPTIEQEDCMSPEVLFSEKNSGSQKLSNK